VAKRASVGVASFRTLIPASVTQQLQNCLPMKAEHPRRKRSICYPIASDTLELQHDTARSIVDHCAGSMASTKRLYRYAD
jgi:hypothetical protein